MSAVLETIAIALAGLALCSGIGVVPARPLTALAGLGLAYLVGAAAVTLVETALVVLGAPLIPSFVAAVGLPIVTGCTLLVRRRERLPPPSARLAPLTWILPTVLFGAVAVLGGIYAVRQPVIAWDGWAIFARKAVWIASSGHLDARLFTDPEYGFIHQDYPLALPLLEALPARLEPGSGGAGLLHGWLFFVAYPWAAGYIALTRLRNPAWVVPVVLLTLTPACFEQGLTGYADLPTAVLLGAGILTLVVWLRDPDRPMLAVSCLLLAGAANTKNEGLVFATLALLVALAYVVYARPRPRAAELGVASLATLALVAPWRIWTAVHGIKGEFSLSSALDPSYVLDRADRAGPAVSSLSDALFSPGWRWLIIGATILAVASLAMKRNPAIALYHLALGLAAFAALVFINVIDTQDLAWRLALTSDRIVTVIPFIAASAAIHLTGPLTAGSGTAPAANARSAPRQTRRAPA